MLILATMVTRMSAHAARRRITLPHNACRPVCVVVIIAAYDGPATATRGDGAAKRAEARVLGRRCGLSFSTLLLCKGIDVYSAGCGLNVYVLLLTSTSTACFSPSDETPSAPSLSSEGPSVGLS